MQGVVTPAQQATFPVMHVCTPDAHPAVFAPNVHEAILAPDLHEGGEPTKDPSCRELLRSVHT